MTREPKWLRIETVLAFHERLVGEHGGSPLLRDRGLLESALASPQHRFTYGETDLIVLAAAYASALTRNHPFVDGNKRTAFMAAYTFLAINGWDINAPEPEVAEMVLALSDRSVSEVSFTEWLRRSCAKTTRATRRRGRVSDRPPRRRRKKRPD